MIRYAIILIAAMGTFGAAAAFQDAPAGTPAVDAHPSANQTIVEKNSAFPVIGPVGWVACSTEDCSDVPNQ
jgi:hypothetical protein